MRGIVQLWHKESVNHWTLASQLRQLQHLYVEHQLKMYSCYCNVIVLPTAVIRQGVAGQHSRSAKQSCSGRG